MVTGTIIEIGGLMIVAAASLQLLLALRSALAIFPRTALPGGGVALVPAASAEASVRNAEQRDIEPLSWLGKRKFRVAMRNPENASGDICSFYLVPLDGRPIPSYRPGQFLTFEIPDAEAGHPAMRCYSLSDSPTQREYYRITVRKMVPPPGAPQGTPPGLGSSYFHDCVQEGDIVEAYAPAGQFYLDQMSDRPVVLIAGGVGLTPLVSMMNWLIATRSNREIWFFYGARNRADHALYEHLAQIRRDCPNVKMFIAYDRADETCQHGVDYNVDGFITIELLQAVLTASNYEFYVCGPPPMMSAIRGSLSEWGVPEEDVRYEIFQAAVPEKTDQPAIVKEVPDDRVYRIEFTRSDRVVEWTSDDDTLLELAEANGVKVRCSCRAGNCGTCLTALQDGSVDYVRPPSREHGEGLCLPCIARPRSDLVIDL